MSYKFAHIADCHLGAFRDQRLRELNLSAFESAIDKCISRKVDFVVVSGDLFHIHLPDLSVINRAVAKMRELKNSGIPMYVIYGSHDYSPTGHSMIDILQSAGLFIKSNVYEVSGDKLNLKVFTDKKTGAKIVGMSARKLGLEKNYYDMLNLESLQSIDGFKIFMFHNAISDYLPSDLQKVTSIPVTSFPKNFDYYAGGHIHITSKDIKEGYGFFVSPGALFGANYKDLERSVSEPNGFFIVEFSDKVEGLEFIEVNVAKVKKFDISLDRDSPEKANNKLNEFLRNNSFEGSVNLIRISGKLSSGIISDIDLGKFKESISEVSDVAYFNTHKLESAETELATVKISSKEEIESEIFSKNLESIENETVLGVENAKSLLSQLRQEPVSGETKTDYSEKIICSGLKVLDIHEN